MRGFFHGLSQVAKFHPQSRLSAHGVTVERDIAYLPDGDPLHTLDVYRPIHRPGPWPIVFYIHGGGFRMLSKDTHWLMGLQFARMGYLTININYRLAPKAPYPAALEDVAAAYRWLADNVASLGGDPDRVAIAGESAGANLATALTVLMARRNPTFSWAADTFDKGLVPRAALPFCGMLQVTAPERFLARRKLPPIVYGAVRDTSACYLDQVPSSVDLSLADPLTVLEAGGEFDRKLPAFFAPVGTRDPLLDDTRRLSAALAALQVPCEVRYYPGGVHTFHAFVWKPMARQCWAHSFAFLDRALRPS